jgi:cytochrome c6
MIKIVTRRAYSLTAVALCCLGGCSKEIPPAKKAPLTPVTVSLPGQTHTGEQLFKQYCSSCHPDGGNVSDPERSLRGSVLRKSHITTPDDVVRIMRKPQSRMIRFDAATVPDTEARAIAEYVLKAFK